MRVRPDLAQQVVALASLVTGHEIPAEPSARLDTAGFDSLAFVEFGEAVRVSLGIEIADAASPETVADLLSLVDSAGTAPPAADGVPPGMGRYQDLVRGIARPLAVRLFMLDVAGREHVPASGPAVLAFNHDSALDVVVAAVASPRRIAVMGKQDVFVGPVVSRLFHELGAFPVDRERWDRRAVLVSRAILERGHLLAMWPEGTRDAHELLPFLPGAAWLALATGAPIVPSAIIGSGAAWPRERATPRRHPIRVVFDAPMSVERTSEPADRLRRAPELTAELRGRIERLLEQGLPGERFSR
jgi:1-acyl-sn-glycerol-3-phosphate acyltransferase